MTRQKPSQRAALHRNFGRAPNLYPAPGVREELRIRSERRRAVAWAMVPFVFVLLLVYLAVEAVVG